MYLRTTQRRNKDGSVVRYYALAENVRHPEKGYVEARVVHSFGRADQLDRAALERLVASIQRVLADAGSGPVYSTIAPPPSLTPGELPAVCEPSLPTRPGSLDSASSDEPRRGPSSTSTTVSAFLDFTVTGMISSDMRPSSIAASARSWLRSAQRSRSGRVSSSSSPTSVASWNICLPLNGLVSPSWTIASSALASPMR